MGLSIQKHWFESLHLNKDAWESFSSSWRRQKESILPSGHHSQPQSFGGKEQQSFAGKNGTSLSNCELMIGGSRLVHQQHICDPGQNTQICPRSALVHFLCFPVVPGRVCRFIGLCRPLRGRAQVLRRLLHLWGARVQWGFVRVSAVVLGAGRTCRPPEVLERTLPALVVVRTEFIRTSSFGIWMPET